MLKKTITAENPVTGIQETRDYHFHLSKADLIRIMGRDKSGNWEEYVKSIVESGDNDRIMDFIEQVVRDSVGYVTPDGLFVKPKDYANAFIASDAYGELFIELLQGGKEGSESFFSAVIGDKAKPSGSSAPTHIQQGKRRKHKK